MKKSILVGVVAGFFVVLGICIYAWLDSASPTDKANANAGYQTDSTLQGNKKTAPYNQSIQAPPSGANTAYAGSEKSSAASQASKSNLTAASADTVSLPVFGEAGLSGLRLPAAGVPQNQALTPLAIGKPGSNSMEQIQQRLQLLVANGRQPSAAEVDAVLADIQKNQGKNLVAGIDLQALRETLARTDRIQQIGAELQAMASNPSKLDQSRLQNLTAEMQRLQTALLAGAPRVPAR